MYVLAVIEKGNVNKVSPSPYGHLFSLIFENLYTMCGELKHVLAFPNHLFENQMLFNLLTLPCPQILSNVTHDPLLWSPLSVMSLSLIPPPPVSHLPVCALHIKMKHLLPKPNHVCYKLRRRPPYGTLFSTMSCSCSFFQFISLLLLLVVLLLSFTPSSILFVSSAHATNPSKNLSSTTMLPSEAEALFKIMESMSADKSWRISYPNPCTPGSSWPGIECKPGQDNHLHVSRLDFGYPPYPTCKSTATFPYEIFSLLPYLQSLFFFKCFTVTKTTFSVSPDRLSSSLLQQLSLRSNPALVGPIPPQISSLKSLQILTLSQNLLIGHIPIQIFGMNSLVHLDLSYNMLTGTIPYQVGSLRNLVGLDLSFNSLTGGIPHTIGQLGALQKLDLSSNSLTGGIPESIETLNSLAFMALSNNKLRGDFPRGLEKLQSLQYFVMDDNPMHIPLPTQLGKLLKLQELRLANSGYTGAIPARLSQLLNLSTLSLQNNRLTGEIPVGFGSLSHMYHLNLSRNLLVGVVPFDPSFLKRLGGNLDLSGNRGLCLNPSEAYSVKIGIGVGICGTNNNTSTSIQPLNKSQAPCGSSKPFFVLGLLIVHGLHQALVHIYSDFSF